MFWGSDQIENSFKILNSILLFAIIGLVIVEFILKQLQPLQLLVVLLIYIVLMWQRISVITYKILLLLGAGFILKQSLGLLNFCFGEQNDIVNNQKMSLITQDRYRNIIIVTGLWIAVMIYAMLLCWRAYEKSKLYMILTNQFVVN